MFEKDSESSYLRVVAPMSYVNTGELGYNAVVRREKVKITVADRMYEHHWDQFVSTTSEGGDLLETAQREAHPIAVNGGSAHSHETRFVARPRLAECPENDVACQNRDFLGVSRFLHEVQDSPRVKLEFVADVYAEEEVCAACVADLEQFWTTLVDTDFVTVPCLESSC